MHNLFSFKPSHVQLHLDNNLEDDEHYYAVADNSAIDSSFQPVIVCNAGNKSGWLICNDPSGVTNFFTFLFIDIEYPFSVNVNKYVEFIYLTTIHIPNHKLFGIGFQKASRSDADQLCQTSGQTLWMYVPSGWLWTKNDYSYWICSKPRENSKI